MTYLIFILNSFAFIVIISLFRSSKFKLNNRDLKTVRNTLLSELSLIRENIEHIKESIRDIQCDRLYCGASEPISQTAEALLNLTEKNQQLDIELQKISNEVLEKYLTKIQIINILSCKNNRYNVVEAELLKGAVSSQTSYYAGEAMAIVKVQFSAKEDFVGIGEIVMVEKKEDGKIMLYFTLRTHETADLVVPQTAFVGCSE